MNDSWKNANIGESEYWQIFTAEAETLKQQEQYMEALYIKHDYYHAPDTSLNMSNLKALDVGGGPVSILLRTNKLRGNQHSGIDVGVVIDPLIITEHQKLRYKYYGLNFIQDQAENINKYFLEKGYFDECFIYNCLQHVENPLKILDRISFVSKKIRIAEPLYIPKDKLHIHTFDENYFNNYFTSDKYQTEYLAIQQIGSCNHYVGIFSVK